MQQLPWQRHQINVLGLPPNYYVKEFRYNGVPAEQGILNTTPGAQLEIVIDNKAASVSGTVTPVAEGSVMLVKWPLPSPQMIGALRPTSQIRDGRFQFAGLAPGDYRFIAVPAGDVAKLQDWNVLNQFAGRAETVRLGPSESRTLTLRLFQ
jgi:hypothetical protein